MTIKNSDVPAMPIELNGFGQYASEAYTGLTKREMFAMHAMQGLLASAADSDGQWTNAGPDNVAFEAVAFADALLKELEK